MTEKLKPCPFCGSEARLIKDDGIYVECQRCFITTGLCGCEEVAIAVWNRRKERTCRFDEDEQFSPGAVKCSRCGEHWFPENDKSRFTYCPGCRAKVMSE